MPSEELLDRAAKAVLDNVGLLARRLRQRPVTGQLSQSGTAVLRRLARTPATVADLARAEGVRPQSMGAVVASLEGGGLVKRQRDRDDGRRVRLTLTKAGREVAERGRSPRGEQLAKGLASGFSDEELEQLVAAAPLLARLASRLS